MAIKSLARMGSTLVAAAAIFAMSAVPAAASGDYINGSDGADISWPQCGGALPAVPRETFGIVGINGGSPYTDNDCFRQEWAWAQAGKAGYPSIYMNLDFGATYNGERKCAASDPGCASYEYGWEAAEYAYTKANYLTGGQSLGPGTWWLDVETMNDWSDQSILNDYVISGAVDYLKTTGRRVGIYSTPMQFRAIAGSWHPGNDVGNWVAGANSLRDYSMCLSGFWPGAQVWLIQYLNLDLDLDQNHSC